MYSLSFASRSCLKNQSLHYLILPCILIQWPHLIYVLAFVCLYIELCQKLKMAPFYVGHTNIHFFFTFPPSSLHRSPSLNAHFMFVHVLKLKPVVEWLPNALTGLVLALRRMYIFGLHILEKLFVETVPSSVDCVVRTSTFSLYVFRFSCGYAMIMWNSKNMDLR